MNAAALRPLAMSLVVLTFVSLRCGAARGEGPWEVTPESQQALQRGLAWLQRAQGREGNWGSNDLGLVSMGALAFLAAGDMPGRGPHGEAVRKALDYVLTQGNKKTSGLLNIADGGRDMYNHGLSTFVLGQAYGMTGDPRIGPTLDRALRLIAQTQCRDGGWDYHASRQEQGHDLSLAVMQAKALRSAVDSGLEVPPEVIEAAIVDVRAHYHPSGCPVNADEAEQRKHPGQFTYSKGGAQGTLAMAAAGVVCLQEFAQYDDWRIEKNLEVIEKAIGGIGDRKAKRAQPPMDPYTLYYVGQALYQVGGKSWERSYPLLRDSLVNSQVSAPGHNDTDGMWHERGQVGGQPGRLYATAVGCFILAMPNRYLPILQEGKIDSLRKQFRNK
ncbi:MAG: squalene--hopene cyclase [Thermoguttaceae bacterium]